MMSKSLHRHRPGDSGDHDRVLGGRGHVDAGPGAVLAGRVGRCGRDLEAVAAPEPDPRALGPDRAVLDRERAGRDRGLTRVAPGNPGSTTSGRTHQSASSTCERRVEPTTPTAGNSYHTHHNTRTARTVPPTPTNHTHQQYPPTTPSTRRVQGGGMALANHA